MYLSITPGRVNSSGGGNDSCHHLRCHDYGRNEPPSSLSSSSSMLLSSSSSRRSDFYAASGAAIITATAMMCSVGSKCPADEEANDNNKQNSNASSAVATTARNRYHHRSHRGGQPSRTSNNDSIKSRELSDNKSDDADDNVASLQAELTRLRFSSKTALQEAWKEVEALQRSSCQKDEYIIELKRNVEESHAREEMWKAKLRALRRCCPPVADVACRNCARTCVAQDNHSYIINANRKVGGGGTAMDESASRLNVGLGSMGESDDECKGESSSVLALLLDEDYDNDVQCARNRIDGHPNHRSDSKIQYEIEMLRIEGETLANCRNSQRMMQQLNHRRRYHHKRSLNSSQSSFCAMPAPLHDKSESHLPLSPMPTLTSHTSPSLPPALKENESSFVEAWLFWDECDSNHIDSSSSCSSSDAGSESGSKINKRITNRNNKYNIVRNHSTSSWSTSLRSLLDSSFRAKDEIVNAH